MMGRWRISIGMLLTVVAVAAIGFAAITVASPLWVGLTTSLTWFLIVASLLGVGFGRGKVRVYWTGFALLGWSFLILTIHPVTREHVQRYLISNNLRTTLYTTLHEPEKSASPPAPAGGMMGVMGGGTTGGGFRSMMGGLGPAQGSTAATPVVSIFDLGQILTMLEALIWAFLGGWMARYFAIDRPARPAASPRLAARPLAERPRDGGPSAS